jgi:hypothetical protein
VRPWMIITAKSSVSKSPSVSTEEFNIIVSYPGELPLCRYIIHRI